METYIVLPTMRYKVFGLEGLGLILTEKMKIIPKPNPIHDDRLPTFALKSRALDHQIDLQDMAPIPNGSWEIFKISLITDRDFTDEDFGED